MSAPVYGDMILQDDPEESDSPDVAPSADPVPTPSKALITLSEERERLLVDWLSSWITEMEAAQQPKLDEWANYEIAYRARADAPSDTPFIGCNRDVVPVIAMAVEPVHARLETGIFKQDPFVNVKPIRKSAKDYVKALEHWMGFYFTKLVPLQKISAPALLEQCKLGTMVFKVPYVQERCRSRWYDNDGKVVSREFLKFRGPRPEHIPLNNFLFPPGYQHLQACPIVAERQLTTMTAIRKLTFNDYYDKSRVDKVAKFVGGEHRDTLEDAREIAVQHQGNMATEQSANEIKVYECWFHYDLQLDEDEKQSDSEYPYMFVATIHPDSRTLLQLRYNPYYHQKFPYVLIPYTISSGSLYGVGIGEMAYTFQNSITASHRNAIDNSYLANCRGFVRKRGAPSTEKKISIYPGFEILVEEPNDCKPFQLADVYQSTITERQNLFGMVEKRTGVSDYMTGRESPALGSRATATSTLALIQEGTRRVEQVMGNERLGYSEILEMCMMCWAQFGLGDYDDYIFGDEETGQLLDKFFKSVLSPENVSTLLTVDISPTDATTNRQVQQQMQLGLIQLMNGYLQQVIQVGQLSMQAQAQGMQPLVDLIKDVVKSAQVMYRDLLDKYDLPNAQEYIPDVLAHLGATAGSGAGITGLAQQLPPVGPGSAPPGGVGGAPVPGPPGAQGPQPAARPSPILPGFA